MAQLFEAAPDNDLPPVPNYNVCPSDRIHVLRGGVAGRRLVAMRWGFVPAWYRDIDAGPLLINARAETIAGKPAFRAACRERRCLIPASGFYEWSKGADGARLPWYVSRVDGEPLALAGVWQDWRRGDELVRSCAIVTTVANRDMAPIHRRMPVIVAAGDHALWLGEAGKGAARLMRPAPEGLLRCHRVSREVNSNRASGPGLIAPLEDGAKSEAPGG